MFSRTLIASKNRLHAGISILIAPLFGYVVHKDLTQPHRWSNGSDAGRSCGGVNKPKTKIGIYCFSAKHTI